MIVHNKRVVVIALVRDIDPVLEIVDISEQFILALGGHRLEIFAIFGLAPGKV